MIITPLLHSEAKFCKPNPNSRISCNIVILIDFTNNKINTQNLNSYLTTFGVTLDDEYNLPPTEKTNLPKPLPPPSDFHLILKEPNRHFLR